ncbi:hypothetical protein GGI20_004576 [Coemansia sp. BCRC 34301]|nr:hypothetical protein GGI20_004576 [Coemansia sp. BCRC 34301]
MARLFADDKTFVDKPTLHPPSTVLANFAAINGSTASRSALAQFVADNFGQEGSELLPVPLEIEDNPAFLTKVNDTLLRAFGRVVNGYWGTLVRRQDFSLCAGCVSSMLPLKYHFVVPGGRFRESYYWDTYFAIEGLLRSGLYDLSKSTIRDLLDFVDTHGFVPNGARVYYLNRSQPPLLSLMVALYYDHTKDLAFVVDALPRLQREHAFWQSEAHVVAVNNVTLNRYYVDSDGPRPEAYAKDYELAHNVSDGPGVQASVYADMATGAETGWDYSTRWVKTPNASPDRLLFGIRTRQVVPVELNAILYQVEQTLSAFVALTNCTSSPDYAALARTRRSAMDRVFYDKGSGLFFDYLLDENRRSSVLSPASLWPYWAFGPNATDGGDGRAFETVDKILGKNPGGFPATLVRSGQQWDYPSAWPPLQYVLMRGALTAGHSGVALTLAQSFVDSVFCAWYATGGSIPGVLEKSQAAVDSGHMFEKFDSEVVGRQGGGGEYVVQAGFGWTNGVLIWTLDTFGADLGTPSCPRPRLPA